MARRNDNAEDWGMSDAPRIRDTFPVFKIEHLDGDDALITCPKVEKRCGNGFIVNFHAWCNAQHGPTRGCPYCGKWSRMFPKET